MKTFKDELGNEVVIIENEDGSVITYSKSYYDEQQAQQVEQATFVTESAPTA